MPTEYLEVDARVETRSVETVNQSFVLGFGVVNQVIQLKFIPSHANRRVIIRVDLPVAVVIVNIQQSDCAIRGSSPSLQPDQQLFHPGVVLRVVEEGDQIFRVELICDDFVDLFVIPLLEVHVAVLFVFLNDLRVNLRVILDCLGGGEVCEPEMSLKVEGIQQERTEVNVEMTV